MISGSVFLRLADLDKLVRDLRRNHLDLVELSIAEPDPDEEDDGGNSLCVSAINSLNPDVSWEDQIDSDPNVEEKF